MTMTRQDGGRPLAVAQVVRHGGGTASVELTVAAKLRDRGHRVTLYGPPEAGGAARAAGFDLAPLDWPSDPPAPGGRLIPRLAGASLTWARQLVPRFGAGVELVVADCTAFGALLAAKLSAVPCAALMPTVYVPGDWPAVVDGVNRARGVLGLPLIESLTEQLLDVDRLLVLTSRAFELPEVQPPERVRYVGPQLSPARRPAGFRLPAGAGPLLLVSLSTTDQGQRGLLERLLAAIAPLPVRALVTLGEAIGAGRWDPPPNVTLERFVPHSAVLAHASLVVTHAGHGTVLAAVSAGVPLVCVPIGRDQPAVAARVTRHGLGVRVEPDAGVADLRAAMEEVLREPGYAQAARRMAAAIEPANRVVDETEELAHSRSGARVL